LHLHVESGYDITDKTFIFGSWIFSPDAFLGSAILGDIIVREMGFERLKKEKCLFDVRKGNNQVIQYHLSYKPTKINEDELNYYYEIDQNRFNLGKARYLKMFCFRNKL
jgi:hypothetical protein